MIVRIQIKRESTYVPAKYFLRSEMVNNSVNCG